MANPQVENGFIMTPREIEVALCRFRIPGEARQVFDFIKLKTWGWNKTEDKISLSQISLGTGLSKVHVIRAREKLIEMNMIVVTQKDNDDAPIYRINKDFDVWVPLPKKVTLPKKITSIIQNDNDDATIYRDSEELDDSGSLSKKITLPFSITLPKKVIGITQKGNDCYPKRKRSLPKKVPTIKTSTKETFTKETSTKQMSPEVTPVVYEPKNFQPEVIELTELLVAQILKNHPRNLLSKPAVQASARRKWPLDIERMIRLDSRAPPEIREMIFWATEHSFWSGNILSASKLREKWDTLDAQRQRDLSHERESTAEAKLFRRAEGLAEFARRKQDSKSQGFSEGSVKPVDGVSEA